VALFVDGFLSNFWIGRRIREEETRRQASFFFLGTRVGSEVVIW
jgi:hypothetical protein